MKNILIRAGISPLDNFDACYMLNHNSIGDNVGNLIYAYSVFKTLMTDSVEKITPNYYKSLQGKADEINEEYDAFIIPLADAFRADFMPEMRKMTALIKELKIPCVIVGVGLRAPFEPGDVMSYPFDEDIKEFIKAVLEKSSIVGVRGEYTSAYLKRLGFREEIDHTVIGCPSMYTNGANINIREGKLTKDSLLSMNASVLSPDNVHEFMRKCETQFPNHYFLPQRLQEMRLLYTGMPYYHKQDGSYPTKITDEVYAKDRVKFFLNIPTWMDFLGKAEMSVGGRLHGNIVATVSGTPSILIPHDARMRELTEYHHLTHVWAKDINENTNLLEIASKLDFQEVSRFHKKNFDHYVDFLDKNGLDHIYKNGNDPKESPLERKIKELDLQAPISSVRNCSFEEMAKRLYEICPPLEKKRDNLKSENVKLKSKISNLERDKKSIKMMNTRLKKENKEMEAAKNEAEEKLQASSFLGVIKRVTNKTLKK
ncbi:MAG: polysaccharide pyruvyl transferase family protein [Velocimicrobium sp.]